MSRPGFVSKIEHANENKEKTLRQKIEKDVDYSRVDKQQPFILQTFAAFQSSLINLHDYPDDFRNYFEESFLDMDLLQDLERSKVINWCRTVKRLYPLKTTGDGNCLLHAVSLALWNIEDTGQFLRRLVYCTLSTDPTGAFKRRWQFYQRSNQEGEANFRLNTSEFSVEWESVVKAAADIEQQQGEVLPFATLESFHLHVLSNILRRPIIVLADKRARNIFGQSLQESNIGGIYLPLETVPAECVKTPVIVGYNMNHFAPLVTQDGDSSSRMDVVPLVTYELEMMMVHYLLPGEEQEVVRLLENYLQMTETVLTETDSIRPILSVRLEKRKLPEDLNLMEDLRQDCEKKFRQWLDQEYGSENPFVQSTPAITPKQNILEPRKLPELQGSNRGPSLAKIMMPVPVIQTPIPPQIDQPVAGQSNRKKCLTTGCMMYGSQEMYNLCSKCFRDYTLTYHSQEQAMRRLNDAIGVEPSAPMPTIPPRDSYIDLSIVPEKCKTENCDFQCSQATFPYCHECYEEIQKYKATQTKSTPIENVHHSIQETTAGWLDNQQQAIIKKPRSGVNNYQVGAITQQINAAQTATVPNELTRPAYRMASSQEPVYMSMLEKMCPTDGCRNHVSRNTEPFCHECHKKEQNSQRLGQPAQALLGQNFNTKLAGSATGVVPNAGWLDYEQQAVINKPHMDINTCQVGLNAQQINIAQAVTVQNEPSRRTYKTASSQEVFISMKDEMCPTKGCRNHVSRNTEPLCHECYNKNQGTSKLDQRAQAVTKLAGSSSGVESGLRGLRMETSQSEIREPVQFVLPSTASGGISPGLVNLATGQVAPPDYPKTHKCKAEDCSGYAVPGNNGHCESCYYKSLFGEGNLRKEEDNNEAFNILSGSSGSEVLHMNANQIMNISEEKPSAAKTQGFNFVGMNLPGNFPAPAMNPTSRSFESPPTGKKITATTGANSYPRKNVEKYLCATPGCQGIRQNNKLDLCYQCYTKASTRWEARSDLDNEETAIPGPNSAADLSCPGVVLTNEEEKRMNPVVTSSKQKVACAGKTCGKLIYPPKKLCDECQEILEYAHASKSKQDFRLGRQNVTAPIRSNPAPQQPRPHTAPVVAKCSVRDCDRYGDPATGNMCTAHFENTQRSKTTTGQLNVPTVLQWNVRQQQIHPVTQRMSNPVSEVTYSTSANVQPFLHRSGAQEDNFTAALTNLERSQKSKSKCIIQGCLNFGSSQKQGLCNKCFLTRLGQ
ncbi:hypothetical protein CHS0354_017970 [Potamilus streckersoni]|uniref:ubiquitinyl hydrolase 1 n=1 Tax=Potamilus streckersoni TaxID=2493646 RepID=A0AAE0RW46_9BIVA|nr:hypothetical protein CHS0354_017970 [Potamilus streckersoni]